MKFLNAHVKSVKADIGTGELTVSFRMALGSNMVEAARLAAYVGKDHSNVEVRVIPLQPELPGTERTVDLNTGEITEAEEP